MTTRSIRAPRARQTSAPTARERRAPSSRRRTATVATALLASAVLSGHGGGIASEPIAAPLATGGAAIGTSAAGPPEGNPETRAGLTGGFDDASLTFTDPVSTIDPSRWGQCSDVDPVAFDELSVVDGWVTVHDPDQGPIASATDAAAHGCAYRQFGPWAADEIEVEFTWSAQRPLEATPLLHVDLATDEGGIGMWPALDLFPSLPGPQSLWALGYIGRDNSHFQVVSYHLLDRAELARWSDPLHPADPAPMKIRSSGGTITVFLDGEQLPLTMEVPPSLRGSTSHGFAIDNNQADPRLPDLPAARGPWSLTSDVPTPIR